MTDHSYRLWLAILVMVSIGACATTDEPDQSGFRSDYSTLDRDIDGRWLYSVVKTGNYSKFYIEPPALLFEQKENPAFLPDELEQLKTCLLVRLIVRLTEDDGYEVMSEPWPGVATFRLGITDVDASVAY